MTELDITWQKKGCSGRLYCQQPVFTELYALQSIMFSTGKSCAKH